MQQYYKILHTTESATDEEIVSSYKKLAIKYHPDKNRDRLEWAHVAMTQLNHAYSEIMSYRFENENAQPTQKKNNIYKEDKPKGGFDPSKPYYTEEIVSRKIVINSFSKIKDTVNDSLYRYFQYNLFNLLKRENIMNRGVFNEIVFTLRKSYHQIKKLSRQTNDKEILQHFDIYSKMILNFYKSSECLNVIDSYKSQYEVDAYRQYKKGDETIHSAQKELFFDRHNKGTINIGSAYAYIVKAEKLFRNTLKLYTKSTWAIETKIKLDFTISLKEYVELFFTEE